MTSRFRTVLLIALGALLMTLVLTLVANPHSMTLAACKVPAKRWSALSLEQKERYVVCNARHARQAARWAKTHRALYPDRGRAVVAAHRAIQRKAARNLRAIRAILEARDHLSWCRSGECVRTLLRRIFVEDPEGAVTVARCESGWHADPVEGLSITGQYVGVLQLGTSERATWGYGIYTSPDPYTAIRATAWDQIMAAHNLFEDLGWRPWQCSASGGLNW